MFFLALKIVEVPLMNSLKDELTKLQRAYEFIAKSKTYQNTIHYSGYGMCLKTR